jgi:uncharacterized membrane protein YidH (DUF202 family)
VAVSGDDHRIDPRYSEAEVRTIKSVEWFQLVRAGFPMLAAGLGVAGLYLFLGLTSDVRTILLGPPIALLGTVVGLVGLRRRFRELRSTTTASTLGYGLVFLGYALVVMGMLVPLHLLA